IRGLAATLAADGNVTMWEADGSIAFCIGEPSLDTSADLHHADALRVRLSASGGRQARLEMRSIAPSQFTQRDVKLFDAAMWTLPRWFSTAAEQLAAPREPLVAAQSFDEAVEPSVRARKRSGNGALLLIMPGHPEASAA